VIPVAQADVEARLRRTLTTDEVAALPGIVAEAGAFIEGYLGEIYDPTDNPAPGPVVIVTSRVCARMMTDTGAIPANADSLSRSMGPLSATTHYVDGSTAGGPWLTKADKIALTPYRAFGVRSVPLVREIPADVVSGS
jgi:hypothetical protein